MTRSATDVMHDIILSAVMDAVDALKAASKGLPNTLLRDINAIHANTAFDDLPPELRTAIASSVRSAFNRLLKEGYSVSSGKPAPPPSPAAGRHPGGDRRPGAGGGERRPGPRPPGGRGPRPPGRGSRPPRKPGDS